MKILQVIIYTFVFMVVIVAVAALWIFFTTAGNEDPGHKTILVVPGDTVMLSGGDTLIIKRLK